MGVTSNEEGAAVLRKKGLERWPEFMAVVLLGYGLDDLNRIARNRAVAEKLFGGHRVPFSDERAKEVIRKAAEKLVKQMVDRI